MQSKCFYSRRSFLAIIYAAAILTAYLYPVNTEETINRFHVLEVRGDYWLHMLLFLPLPFLMCPAGKSAKACFFSILFCLFAAATAEGIHWLIPYRSFNPFDMLANISGVLFSTVILVLQRIMRRMKR
jgi:hypothetical protein